MESETDEGSAIDAIGSVKVCPERLSLHLIVKRHLPEEAETWNQEQVIEALSRITHLRLDRENIGDIDGLELLGGGLVTNVYLQQNRITTIHNLDCLPRLQFLTLAGNRITAVQNLTHLTQLLFLDLSDNAIEDFDIDEFPQSLIILDLRGNPCCNKPDHRGSIVQELANLKQLDGQEVTKLEKLEVGFHISSDEDSDEGGVNFDDDDDDDGDDGRRDGATASTIPTVLGSGSSKPPHIEVRLQDVTTELLLRSQDRLEAVLQCHKHHVQELNNMRIRDRQLKAAGRSDPAQRKLAPD